MWRLNNPEKRSEQRRREKVRRKLRDRGILPPVGSSMTQQEQQVYDQIGRDDYSFWDISKRNGGKGKLHNGGIQIKAEHKSSEFRICYRAMDNAKRRGFEFNLTPEDIFIPEFCPFLGVKIETDFDKNHNDNYYSIDRIDSSMGYIKGNVQVISNLANAMKNSATKDQLITFSKNVLKMFNS
jgi:hypothetical protein